MNDRFLRVLRAGRAFALAVALPATLFVPSAASATDWPDCSSQHTVRHERGYDKYVTFPSASTRTTCEMGTWQGGTYNLGVVALQRALNACYLKGLTVDGRFGARTRDALASVQRAVGVQDDGIYGPLTANAMKWPAYNSDHLGVGCDAGSNYR
jgi:peptidoglycan hydrolase-like protein with peptidoglycan-binding domain